jgi:hypothetical protein
MSIITRPLPVVKAASTRRSSRPFGQGVFPAETPQERHKREQFDVCDAVAEGRAIRIPLDSPRYASFVAAMNQPATMRRGFVATGGAYIPSDTESLWATLDGERAENERQDARWDALAQEAFENDHHVDEMLAIGACG